MPAPVDNTPALPVIAPADRRKRISISVRELAEFVLRAGDLGGSGQFAGANRALEGTRGHQRLQRSRPAGYQPEVSVAKQIETSELVLEIKGRIDGVLPQLGFVIIEEIKTVDRPWAGAPNPVHLGQAMIYAAIYAEQHGLDAVEVRISNLDLHSGETTQFDQLHVRAELAAFFSRVTAEYLDWIERYLRWCAARDASIGPLAFPFAAYRPGQRALAVAVYRAIRDGGQLFAEAPTGIGKTISVLFPALKALARGESERVFYLTARTLGRTVAEKALADLRAAGLRLRAVTLTARDKICFNRGQPCDIAACPYAIGYYDRIKTALRRALESESFTRPEIEQLAREHRVCPFELSLDLALWCDLVICDFNYVFDPAVSLKRFFDQEPHRYTILVDEAHHLVERGRDMFSAELRRPELLEAAREIEPEFSPSAKALKRLAKKLSPPAEDKTGSDPAAERWSAREDWLVSRTAPSRLAQALRQFQDEAEPRLARAEPSPARQRLLEIYSTVLAFRRVLEIFDDRFAALFHPESGRLRLYCLDPSKLIRETLARRGAAVFFSATLTPLDYFRDLLGADPADASLRLDSPFAPGNLCVLVHARIATRLRARAGSCEAVAASIAAFVNARAGNYLVYFPSYDYLQAVLARFRPLAPGCEIEAQLPAMDETQRELFINRFQAGTTRSRAGFAVMGGIFGEGIDLVGERLIGVVIVGVGLPQISLERNLVREHCEAAGRPGFDYAYTCPGMNRVVQAAGRVIRSEKDRGALLLIDERFATPPHRALLPSFWHPRHVRNAPEISAALASFWNTR